MASLKCEIKGESLLLRDETWKLNPSCFKEQEAENVELGLHLDWT